MKIKIIKDIDRLGDYILTNYNQLTIFSFYLSTDLIQLTEDDIKYYAEDKIKISNPLRVDTNPSLGFYYVDDKLKMHDFANALYRGDMFDLVGFIIDEDCYTKNGFINICKNIISNIEPDKSIINTKHIKKKIKNITPYTRNWTQYDEYYWNLGGVDIYKQTDVFPVQSAYEGNNNLFLHTNDKNPCYAYFKGHSIEEKVPMFKLYMPNVKKGKSKFYSNLNLPIDLRGFGGGKLMIITKSDKDRYVLKSSIERLGIIPSFSVGDYTSENIHISNVSSESIYLTRAIIEYILSIYDKLLFNLDFDREGIFAGYYYKKVFNVDTIYIGNTFDITKISNKEIIRLFEKIKNNSDNNILFKRDFINFVDENRGTSICKDFYEYSKMNKPVKLDKLIMNKIIQL